MYQKMTELKIAVNELKEAIKEGIKGLFCKGGIVPDREYVLFNPESLQKDVSCAEYFAKRFVTCKCGYVLERGKAIGVDSIVDWLCGTENGIEKLKSIYTDYYCPLCKPKEVKNGKVNPK